MKLLCSNYDAIIIFDEFEKKAAQFHVIFAAINKFFLSVNVSCSSPSVSYLKMVAHSFYCQCQVRVYQEKEILK